MLLFLLDLAPLMVNFINKNPRNTHMVVFNYNSLYTIQSCPEFRNILEIEYEMLTQYTFIIPKSWNHFCDLMAYF